MTINIVNHDPTIRYKIFIESGGVRKTIHVPVGHHMPLTWARPGANETPLRPGVASGYLLPYGGEQVDFSFEHKEIGKTKFANDKIEITL